MRKRLFTIMCALASVLWGFNASAEVVEYACGATVNDNVTVSIDTETGVMTISGTGAMTTSYTLATLPWKEYKTIVTKAVVEEGVTNVGNCTFMQFAALEEVSLSGTVTSLGTSAFNGCTSLPDVEFTERLTTIGNYAFEKCTSIKSLTIPNTIKSLGIGSYYQCKGLTELVIESAITEIPKLAFADCYALESVSLPEGLEVIGEQAFDRDSKLKSINLPSTLTTIAKCAFGKCGLTSVVIPKSVISINEIGSNVWPAFYCCKSLKSIIVEEGNPVFDSRDNCNAIIETATNKLIIGCGTTKIPKGVKTIGRYSFYEIPYSSDNIVYPYSVETIEYNAYYLSATISKITELIFGASLNSINNYAYSGQKKISKVVSFATVAPGLDSSSNPFGDAKTETNATLYYPKGSDYSSWSSYFSKMVEIDLSGECGDNLTWEFDTETYTLKISGSGAMTDYTASNSAPWSIYAKAVETVILATEQTTIDNLAFSGCSNLTTVIYEGENALKIESGVFNDVAENAVLYVKEGKKTDYSSVTGVDVKEITLALDVTEATIGYAESVTLTPAYSLADFVGDVNYTWTSSEITVATVADGVVTPVNPGETDVTVSVVTPSGNTLEAVCRVTVVDAATGIENVNVETKGDGVMYDLMGRKVENPAQGIYVKNGKKIFVK